MNNKEKFKALVAIAIIVIAAVSYGICLLAEGHYIVGGVLVALPLLLVITDIITGGTDDLHWD